VYLDTKGVIVDFQDGMAELFRFNKIHVFELSSETFMAFLRREMTPSHLLEFF
jgi:hypothetical protein